MGSLLSFRNLQEAAPSGGKGPGGKGRKASKAAPKPAPKKKK